MELRYNVSGARRKELVSAISARTGIAPVYKGAPTFAYVVWNYAIGRNGEITYDDRTPGEDVNALRERLAELGFGCEVSDESEARDPDRGNRAQFNGDEITDNEVLKLSEREELGLGRERSDLPGDDGIRASEVPDDGTLTIELPLEGYTPEKLDNLIKLIEGKASLIKAALGKQLADQDLPVIMEVDKLRFPWFTADLAPDEFEAWARFISALCRVAKEAKRVTAKDKPNGNPKFSFRVFLIRLGMVGDEFKRARKILLRNLPGNSAFSRGGRPTYTVHCHTLANGNEDDAIDRESVDFHGLARAKAYAKQFSEECDGLRFAGCHVEDENGGYLYEILTDGTVNEK